jgi:hypothetical protein
MNDCPTQPMHFETDCALALEAAFDGGGMLTSDGGLPFLARMDSELGVSEALAACIPEWRTGAVRHSLVDLVRQRVLQIACGYEDQNDATLLRSDPLSSSLPAGGCPRVVGRRPGEPAHAFEAGENAPGERACYQDGRGAHRTLYWSPRKGWQPSFAGASGLRLHRRPGARRSGGGSLPHGYFGQHQYHPLLVFDGENGQIVVAPVLRAGNAHVGAAASLAVLKRLVERIRARWPEASIEVRADAGFALLPQIYEYCEAEGVLYSIGLIPNARLEEMARPLVEAASLGAVAKMAHGESPKVRLISEATYQAGSWSKERRVLYKVEVLEKGMNTRFVVSNRPEESARTLYDDCYIQRGERERIG